MAEPRSHQRRSRAGRRPPRTFIELIDRCADEFGDREAYLFLSDGGAEASRLTYGALARRARALARRLARLAAPSDRVLLLYPPGLEFIVALCACMVSGLVAVPAQPPGRRRGRERLETIARDARPALLATAGTLARRAASWVEDIPALAGCRVVATDRDDVADDAPGSAIELSAPEPSSLAFLQYTSGSTSSPRGVMVRHDNLIQNEAVIRRAFGQSPESVIVSWLPLYHDMGLIGGVLQPLYAGARCILAAPPAFLRRPALWLETIHRYRATTSGGPDFAYALCSERVDPGLTVDGEPLDLSSWRVAFNGSETVRASTLERFAEVFAPCGFRAESAYPCYGLAEATLFVTGGSIERAPRVLEADAAALESGRRAEPRPGARRAELVSCGVSPPGHRVVIADPERGTRSPSGEVGEIWVAGPSIAAGYWGRPDETRETFEARLVGDAGGESTGSYLRTGDLGFLLPGPSGDELYVAGRLKDLIILRGRNLYPQDIELTARRSGPLRAGAVAAFSVPGGQVGGEGEPGIDAERLVIVAELERSAEPATTEEIGTRVRVAIAEEHETSLHELVLIRFGTLPKTPSGKVRRRACRRLYLENRLDVVRRSRQSEGARAVAPGVEEPTPRATWSRTLARILGVPPEAIVPDRPLVALGLDSLGAAELATALEERGVESDWTVLLEGATAADLESLASAAEEPHAAMDPQEAEQVRRFVTRAQDLPSLGQEAFHLRARLASSGAVDVVLGAAHLEGALHRSALVVAMDHLVRRHPALRTGFTFDVDGRSRRMVESEVASDVRWHEPIPDAAGVELGTAVQDALQEAAARGFDLARPPLVRLDVWPLDPGPMCPEPVREHVVLFTAHHAVVDFRSLEVLALELGATYEAVAPGGWTNGGLPGWLRGRIDRGVHDRFVAAERQFLETHRGYVSKAYWERRLAPPLPVLALPADRPRPPVRRFAGNGVTTRFSGATVDSLLSLARARDATPFAVLLAAYQALLGRLAGQDDVVVGVPASTRSGDVPHAVSRGTPAERPAPARRDLQRAVGYFVNPVPIRTDIGGGSGLGGLVDRLRGALAGDLRHRQLPFPVLAARHDPGREGERPPVFQTMVVFQSRLRGTSLAGPPSEGPGDGPGFAGASALALGLGGEPVRLGPLAGRSVAVAPPGVPLDLLLTVAPLAGADAGPWGASLQFDADLFDRTTARRLLARFERFLAAGLEAPDRSTADLPLLFKAERLQLLVEWSCAGSQAAGADPLSEASSAARFFARAAEAPDAPAIHHREATLSYGELARRALAVGEMLQARGVGPDDRVAVLLARSPDLVAALLGVLAAGAAYVPLDPALPRERLRRMLVIAAPACLVTLPSPRAATEVGHRTALVQGEGLDPSLPRIEIEPAGISARRSQAGAFRVGSWPAGALPTPVPSSSLSHVVFTSGSTGEPKGVAIEHRSVAALLAWAHERFAGASAGALARVLAPTSVGFDLSVFELFAPLTIGGSVVLLRDALELAEPGRPAAAAGATLLSTVPSAAAELVRRDALPPGLEVVALAGEPLPGRLVAELLEGARVREVLNLYGPSEDTTYSTVWSTSRSRVEEPPIGRPLPGGRLYLVDRCGGPVPAGVPGELWLGGEGLARGYLGRPARTAVVFVPSPFAAHHRAGTPAPGERLYRTGDLARFRPDGQVQFLGRIDHQVKLRGFRIEPGEVEAVLLEHAAAVEAVVVAVGQGGARRLVAHVGLGGAEPGRDAAVSVGELRRRVAEWLPRSVVPEVVLHRELPRTPNGKVDRPALRWLGSRGSGSGDPGGHPAAGEPRGPVEELLAGLWEELLTTAPGEGPGPFGREDDFFAHGGHSLLATQLAARIEHSLGVELPVSALFEAPTLADQAAAVEERLATASAERLALRSSAGRDAPLAFAQERIWFLDRLDPRAALYVLPGVLELAGPLDAPALAVALAALAGRHEVLRTRFERRDPTAGDGTVVEGLVQVVDPPPPPRLPLVDHSRLRAADPVRADAQARCLTVGPLARRPFDLWREPGLRMVLVRHARDEHRLLLVLHHAVADGWSLGVAARELAVLYRPASSVPVPGESAELPELPVQFRDYARWQRSLLAGPVGSAQLAWWRRALAGLPETLELPTDRPRPAVRRGRGTTLPWHLPAAAVQDLERVARERGATRFMALLALFQVLLGRWSAQDDLAVGVPVAGRHRAELEPLMGCFVNILVLRGDLTGRSSFTDLLKRVRRTMLGAFAHQDLPFERLVQELAPRWDRSRTPLVQVMLVDQPAWQLDRGATSASLEGLVTHLRELHPESSKMDLSLTLPRPSASGGGGSSAGGSWRGWFELDQSLFDPTTIERMGRRLSTLIAAAAAEPDRPLDALAWLPAAERHQVLLEADGDGESRPGQGPETLHGLVLARAAAVPETVALERDGGGEPRGSPAASLTYGELERRSRALAGALVARGLQAGEPVAILAERSLELIVGLLAILRAGGAYVPLDPQHPEARVSTLLEDCGASILLVGPLMVSARAGEVGDAGADHPLVAFLLAGREPELEVLPIGATSTGSRASKDPWTLPADDPDLPAYVLYTSGSTGHPKGVVNGHRGPVHRVRWGQECFRLKPEHQVLQKTPVSFDVSVWEVFWPLAAGARLVLARPGGHRDGRYLAGVLARQRIDLVHFVPSMLRVFLEAGETFSVPALNRVLASGEALTAEDVARFVERLPGVELYNLYGPTEAAVEVTVELCVGPAGVVRPVSLGRAAPGCRLGVVDTRLRPAGLDVPGELLIGGVQVARGYLGRPGATATAFVPDPRDLAPGLTGAGPGRRVYRTGDRVRRFADGRIGFLGRLDSQLKVRGVRIEAGEIEARLVGHPDVMEAVVGVCGSATDARLVAWLVLRPGVEETEGSDGPITVSLPFDTFLLKALPSAMVPSRFVIVSELPRLASGKVDRKSLPEPGTEAPSAGGEPPSTETEEAIAEMCRELLGAEAVGVNDDFFRLGGHSLLAARLLFRIEERYGVELPLGDLFDRPTVRGVASILERALAGASSSTRERSPIPEDLAAEGSPSDLDALVGLVGELTDEEVAQLLEGDPVARDTLGAVTARMSAGGDEAASGAGAAGSGDDDRDERRKHR